MQEAGLFVTLAEIAGVFVGFGALIAVRSGGASDAREVAGIRAGDVLLAWNGTDLESVRSLMEMLQESRSSCPSCSRLAKGAPSGSLSISMSGETPVPSMIH